MAECLNFAGCGTSVMKFGGDTIIGLHQYKKIIIDKDSSWFGIYFFEAAREDTISKQIFFHTGNAEYLVYDFSLQQGDTFVTNISGCYIQMVVDSVSTLTLINGEVRKIMYLNQDQWIEGIGSLVGIYYAGIINCINDVYTQLICFTENDTLKYMNNFYQSCYYNTTSLGEVENENIFIAKPNPFSDYTTITINQPSHGTTTVNIYNSFGERTKQYKNVSGKELKIEKGDLQSGMYFIQLLNDDKEISRGKIVIL